MSSGAVPSADTEWVAVQRVVLPRDDDQPSVLPLYLDWRDVVSNPTTKSAPKPMPFRRVGARQTRRSLTVPAGERVSFAAYFNAFPAAYWRQWTVVDRVRLELSLDAPAIVELYRSTSRGTFHRVDGVTAEPGRVTFETSLRTFGDGGYLWFDVEALDAPVTVADADWLAPRPADYRSTRVSVAITTFNRPDDCVGQMRRFADAPELLERLDQLMITDQGTQPVRAAAGFDEASARLGAQFRLIEQGNLGGSGGFSRGMFEGVRRDSTDYVMLMDDDVLVETEGILRAVNFADFALRPTLVGGHMLSLTEPSVLHNIGESVDLYSMTYVPLEPKLERLDFALRPLRAVPSLHRRWDVDYNAWWMCLVPRQVIEDIGLSLPAFIKWDDAEYGLRAREHGYQTVTLPGTAVWHMPWTEKDDSTDWQAYFHQRNRWLTALIHTPYRQGGSLGRISLAIDLRHLISMQYSTVALRLRALEDILSGPDHLHRGLPSVNSDVRRLRGEFRDAKVLTDVAQYPEVVRRKPLPHGRAPEEPETALGMAFSALRLSIAALRKPSPFATEHPAARISAQDAKWWRLGAEESALVSTADGGGVTLHTRETSSFVAMLGRSLSLHLRLLLRWQRLSRQYREAATRITSPEEWATTFERSR